MTDTQIKRTEYQSTRALAAAAIGCLAVFPVIVIVLNLVQSARGYDTARQAVSELALGRGGALMAVAFCSLGAGTILLGAVIRRTTEGTRVRTALLTFAGLLSFVSAAFHTDLTGARATTHGTIHNTAGIVTFLAMLLTMAISSRRFRKEAAWRRFAGSTAVLTGAGVLTFFLIPALGSAHFGIAQRLFIGTFVCWMLAASAYAVRTVGAEGTRADRIVGLAEPASL